MKDGIVAEWFVIGRWRKSESVIDAMTHWDRWDQIFKYHSLIQNSQYNVDHVNAIVFLKHSKRWINGFSLNSPSESLWHH